MARPTVPIKVTYLLASLFAYLLIDAKYFDPDKFKLRRTIKPRSHPSKTRRNARQRTSPRGAVRCLACVGCLACWRHVV